MKSLLILLPVVLVAITGLVLAIKTIQLRKFSVISRGEASTIIDRFILIISFVILATTILFDFNYLGYKAPVPYSDIDSITFADFRGLSRPGARFHNSARFATVSSEIKVRRAGTEYVYIESFFYPARSYVYYPNLYDNVLLGHEMCHFRITEYHARLMRKEISVTPGAADRKTLNSLRKHIVTAAAEMQHKYDSETRHNTLQEEQVRWQVRIDSLLTSLDGYQATTIKIPVN